MADIYTGKLDPITDLEKIDRLVTQLQTEAEKKTILKGKQQTRKPQNIEKRFWYLIVGRELGSCGPEFTVFKSLLILWVNSLIDRSGDENNS